MDSWPFVKFCMSRRYVERASWPVCWLDAAPRKPVASVPESCRRFEVLFPGLECVVLRKGRLLADTLFLARASKSFIHST